MMRASAVLLLLTGCGGRLHLYEKAGQAQARAFERQAASHNGAAAPRGLDGRDARIVLSNQAAVSQRGGGATEAGAAPPQAGIGATPATGAETGGTEGPQPRR